MGKDVWSVGFQQRLEIVLSQHSISKAEMARRCELPSRTIENYFKGHKPGIEALIALSKGLKVPVDWLLGDEGFHPDPKDELLKAAIRMAVEEILVSPKMETSFGMVSDTSTASSMIANNAVQKYQAIRGHIHDRSDTN